MLDEKLLLELTDAEIGASISVHLTGPLRLIRLLAPKMIARIWRSPDEGADMAVWLATLPDDGPTSGFFRGRKPIEW